MSIKINIVGRGNVGHHLLRAFSDEDDCEVAMINPHSLDGLDLSADFILIAVSDRAISKVTEKISDSLKEITDNIFPIIAHTSGSTSIDSLSILKDNYGVFYPLQTFSKEVPLDYSLIPIFIEADNKSAEEKLIKLATLISKNVNRADSNQRRGLHLASIFACNFTNHLWALSEHLLEEYSLPFDVLSPLIKETTRKAMTHSPASVQTGPAARNDIKTIQTHLAMLEMYPDLMDIYSTLSKSIIKYSKQD